MEIILSRLFRFLLNFLVDKNFMDRIQIERNSTVLCIAFGVIDAVTHVGHTDVSYCLSRQTLPPVDSIGPHTSPTHQPSTRTMGPYRSGLPKTHVGMCTVPLWIRP